MKFKLSSDEIQRGILILVVGALLGVVIGLLNYCDSMANTEPRARLPDYNPFKTGVPPLIDSPAQYSDFIFSLNGIPRFLPPWLALVKSENVLGADSLDREWELLGNPLDLYTDDQELERALDEVLINR